MSNMGSAPQGPAQPAATSIGAAQTQHQRGRERASVFFNPAAASFVGSTTEREAQLPDWKLRCLVAEYGLPPSVRGLHIGGSF